jgi:hypothetical protein
MNTAIKVLAWYTILVAAFSAVNIIIATAGGQIMKYTLPVCLLNVALLIPLIVFAVLVIIRMRRGNTGG